MRTSSSLLFLSDEISHQRTDDYSRNRAVVIWLTACAVTILGMILLGGVTRLTGSGLSMVDWRPIMGIFPPMSNESWIAVFEQYKLFPEYQYVNTGISLLEFKTLFWFEYAHRLLGRFIGLLFFLPLLYFWRNGDIPRCIKPHMLILLLLGAVQGLLGWYMVKSGLADNPHVSQYRLMSHLCLAVLIFGYIIFISAELRRRNTVGLLKNYKHATAFPAVLLTLTFVMIALGGLVAGTKSGQIYNTFPHMNGELVPTGLLALSPMWINIFENPVMIQFSHRTVAWVLLVAGIAYFLFVNVTKSSHLKIMAGLLMVAIFFQGMLGIFTLLNKVPVVLGVLHQGGAMVVFLIAVLLYQRSRHIEIMS